jgi:hypothetical protein
VARIGRSLAIGTGIGAVLALVLVVGAFGYEAYRTRGRVDEPSSVIVVFAIEGEDGGAIAHTAVVVSPDAGGGSYYLADTSATVSVPGLTDARLASTYVFDGAAGVATSHDGGRLRPTTGWVDIAPAAWAALMQPGFEITLAQDFDVFDGKTYFEFPAGTRVVDGAELRALANGMEYLPTAERRALREAVAKASLTALVAGEGPPEGVVTNLSAKGWTRFTRGLRAGLAKPSAP